MAEKMRKATARAMAHLYFPDFLAARQQAVLLDKWQRGEQYELEASDLPNSDFAERAHGRPFMPSGREVTEEYENVMGLAPSNWAGLITRAVAQTAYVDGVRRPGVKGNLASWATWQANRWDSKQIAVHSTAIGLGVAYGVVVPGVDPLTGDKMAKMLGKSPKSMAAFYDNDDDEWASMAIEAVPQYGTGYLGNVQTGWFVTVYDAYVNHRLSCKGDGVSLEDWTYIDFTEHGLPVPPVARCVNRIDLDGRATGEIEPVLPLLRRVDQDMFDRLIVQRFGAWKVRYIAGMAKPDSKTEARLQAIKLKVEDLLISGDHQTKFGTLDASDLKGFIEAHDADLRVLAAITQTPPHHLLGLSSNLQAEALAAAESGLQRKSHDFKMNAGEFHEQMFRMAAWIRGDMEEARATDMQVRWRDTESRSMSQAADALGKLAVQLKVPVEMLWERIPGWTDSDTERAKELVEEGGIEAILREVLREEAAEQQEPDDEGGTDAPPGPQE